MKGSTRIMSKTNRTKEERGAMSAAAVEEASVVET